MASQASIYDERTEAQRKADSERVRELTARNMDRFGVALRKRERKTAAFAFNNATDALGASPNPTMTQSLGKLYDLMRKREEDISGARKKVLHFPESSGGGFCVYTDNGVQVPQSVPVVTISGLPSFTYEWSKLEKALTHVRWINFLIPGLDGYDERARSPETTHCAPIDASVLLRRLLDHLGVQKVVLLSHSFGGFVMRTAIDTLKDRVVSIGMFGTGSVHASRDNALIRERYAQVLQEEARVEVTKKVTLEQYRLLDAPDGADSVRARVIQRLQATRPNLRVYENLVNLRCWVSPVISYEDSQRTNAQVMQPYPKFFAAGADDIFSIKDTYEIAALTHASPERNTRVPRLSRQQREYVLARGGQDLVKNLDFDNISANFSFVFDQTGHSVHWERAQELVQPLRAFLLIADAIVYGDAPAITPSARL